MCRRHAHQPWCRERVKSHDSRPTLAPQKHQNEKKQTSTTAAKRLWRERLSKLRYERVPCSNVYSTVVFVWHATHSGGREELPKGAAGIGGTPCGGNSTTYVRKGTQKISRKTYNYYYTYDRPERATLSQSLSASQSQKP